MLVRMSGNWYSVKFKIRGLNGYDEKVREEREIMRAAFDVQVKHGSLLSNRAEPRKAGFGSAPVLCRAAKWQDVLRNHGRAGRALRRAEAKGFCDVFKIAEPGLRNGANRIILSSRCFRLEPYQGESRAPYNLVWVSRFSESDLPDDQVENHEASREAWAQGLASFRGGGT